jgi:hypothetical protein
VLVGNFLLWGESVPRVFANKKRPSLTNFPEIWGLGRLGSVPTDPPTGFLLPMHLAGPANWAPPSFQCQTRQLASNAPFAPLPDPPTGHLLASNAPFAPLPDPPTGFQLPMHLARPANWAPPSFQQTFAVTNARPANWLPASNAPFAPLPDPPTGHLLASNKPSLSPTQPVCPSVLTIYYFHMTCRPTGQDPRKADLGSRPVVQLPPPSARLCRVN